MVYTVPPIKMVRTGGWFMIDLSHYTYLFYGNIMGNSGDINHDCSLNEFEQVAHESRPLLVTFDPQALY